MYVYYWQWQTPSLCKLVTDSRVYSSCTEYINLEFLEKVQKYAWDTTL